MSKAPRQRIQSGLSTSCGRFVFAGAGILPALDFKKNSTGIFADCPAPGMTEQALMIAGMNP